MGESECVNGETGNERRGSQAGSNGRNDTSCHCWDEARQGVVGHRQWRMERCRTSELRLSLSADREPPCKALPGVVPLRYRMMKWNNGNLAGSIVQRDAWVLDDRKQIVKWDLWKFVHYTCRETLSALCVRSSRGRRPSSSENALPAIWASQTGPER